jgi:hypothetical protein
MDRNMARNTGAIHWGPATGGIYSQAWADYFAAHPEIIDEYCRIFAFPDGPKAQDETEGPATV